MVGKRERHARVTEFSLAATNSVSNNHHVKVKVDLCQESKRIPTEVMIDSGTTNLFIDQEFAERNGLVLTNLTELKIIRTIDGTEISSGQVTHKVVANILTGDRQEGVRRTRHCPRITLAQTT